MAFGRYVPSNTLLHKLDPRAKILCAACVMGAAFGTRFVLGAGCICLFLIGLGLAVRLPKRLIFKNLAPVLPVLIVVFGLNAWLTPGTPLRGGWVTVEGLIRGLQISGQLCAVVCTAALLTLTTSPLELSDGLESLLRPLKGLHLPVDQCALALTIALRFVPTLFEEADRLHRAQLARGADFSGGPIRRTKRLIPLLLPLIVSAFSRADRLALALEARAYQSRGQRSRFHPLTMTSRDILALAGALLLLLGAL